MKRAGTEHLRQHTGYARARALAREHHPPHLREKIFSRQRRSVVVDFVEEKRKTILPRTTIFFSPFSYFSKKSGKTAAWGAPKKRNTNIRERKKERGRGEGVKVRESNYCKELRERYCAISIYEENVRPMFALLPHLRLPLALLTLLTLLT